MQFLLYSGCTQRLIIGVIGTGLITEAWPVSALLVAGRDGRTDSTLGPAAAQQSTLFVLIAPCRAIIFRSDVAAIGSITATAYTRQAATMKMNM